MTSKDFPRGGKRALEPLEYRELNDELFNELNSVSYVQSGQSGLSGQSAQETQSQDTQDTLQKMKKRKKNLNEGLGASASANGTSASVSDQEKEKEEVETSKNVKSISMFSYQKININNVYFGVVSLVSSLFITITLPNNLKVNCSIMEISSILSENINKIMGTTDNDDGQMDIASDDGAGDELPDLKDYFTVGQQVACKVLSLSNPTTEQQGNDATSTRPDSTQSSIAKKVVQVTVDPEKVWSHIKDDSWVKGVVVEGVVESKQDYGWNIRLSPTKKAFLKFDKEKSTGNITSSFYFNQH